MSVIRLPIDIKSLYFNIQNDNVTGHTPTVATPLKQGASIRPELQKLFDIPENINPISREGIASLLLSKSRAQAKIDNIYVFNNVSVNWNHINPNCSFCFYIREETDPGNVHCGRLKMHYPQSLIYSDEHVEVDNKQVIKCISSFLKDYAFIVEAFEFDTETNTLNFDTTIVGENGIPYSKVFINRRGVGSKFSGAFAEIPDVYDSEIISLRERLGYEAVDPENFGKIYEENSVIAYNIALNELENSGAENTRILRNEYPYALYDIQYSIGKQKFFLVVRQTATRHKYFNLTLSKIKFISDFESNVYLWLITDVLGNYQIHKYTFSDINHIEKSISSITYSDKGDTL